LSKWSGKPSKKGTGFAQPLAAHQHWHIDVSYLNIGGTFYYLCSILDGFSPVHRELGHQGVDDRGGHRDHLAGVEKKRGNQEWGNFNQPRAVSADPGARRKRYPAAPQKALRPPQQKGRVRSDEDVFAKLSRFGGGWARAKQPDRDSR
jgi:hypothetical protein